MVNNEKFAKRLKHVIDYYGESAAAFAEKIGVQRSSISHILSGRNKPSLEFVLKVLSAYPEVELYWLLNGTGEFPATAKALDFKSVNNPIPEGEKKASEILHESNSNKTIERIVIFYSDGSFKNFQN
ncbi:helix-turn-helix transcriptional regulator [Seonamhaeicola sediminis]|uniref:Helix-turn-helix transcriptional regulator n=1 Tax=Seonamhaeicola sediminis TaxID=2528206 RepID=A0A562YEJ0_9FLAO|nr:helix-turn-helix transcriptional regulator [Seonamhaeicola sediminis]TWO33045.1 helix-turn-helix transcriptional regulator [Seonamhaeicola sediminis]